MSEPPRVPICQMRAADLVAAFRKAQDGCGISEMRAADLVAAKRECEARWLSEMQKPNLNEDTETGQEWGSLGDGLKQLFARIGGDMDNDGDCENQLKKALKNIDSAYHGVVFENFEIAKPLCESPIERRILPWLICQPPSFRYVARVLLQDQISQLRPSQMALVPQYRASRYRLDFAFVRIINGSLLAVGVECDGKEFHKDEERDANRDAAILAESGVINLCRISGRLIFRDAEKAAARAVAYTEKCWRRVE
ncbi:hypothetical protein L0337_46145 [candidate division KSB1 bacterium]|nr:hypothetical protein [candidate division KSB1 bacterium]